MKTIDDLLYMESEIFVRKKRFSWGLGGFIGMISGLIVILIGMYIIPVLPGEVGVGSICIGLIGGFILLLVGLHSILFANSLKPLEIHKSGIVLPYVKIFKKRHQLFIPFSETKEIRITSYFSAGKKKKIMDINTSSGKQYRISSDMVPELGKVIEILKKHLPKIVKVGNKI